MADAQEFYVPLPNGSFVHVPAGASPDQLGALRTKLKGMQVTPPDALTQKSQATAQAAGAPTGPAPVPGKASIENAWQAHEAARERLEQLQQHAMRSPTPFTDVASVIMPAVGLAEAAPTTAKAGEKLADVMKVAKDTPIPKLEPFKAAARGEELASRGGQLPKILGDFLKRTEDIGTKPLTYEEARDFYTNARLSMNEYLQSKPNMWRQVTLFKQALGDAIKEGLQPTGQLPLYEKAMTEYRRATILKRVMETALKAGIPIAIGYKANKAINMLGER